MAAFNIAEEINTLTPEQQESVLKFIEFLKTKGGVAPSPFLAAAQEFMNEHPEILRRLAQ